MKPERFKLSSTTVLIMNATSMAVKCPANVTKLNGCTFCIHVQKVPCLCALYVDTIVLSPKNCKLSRKGRRTG